MHIRIRLLTLLSVVITGLVLASATVASAHEHREFHGMELTVGFGSEPAYEAFQNAAEIRVMRNAEKAHGEAAKGEHGHGEQTPVLGLEKTIQVEVTHVGTGIATTLPVRRVFGQPGLYRAHLVPTASGQYRFRFFGTIEGKPINETFESGPGRFNDIEPQASIQFPVKVSTERELEGVVRSAASNADEAGASAASALDRATMALAVGVVGIALGTTGLALAFSKRKKA